MSRMDELKVYTGKEAIEALLEGKTLSKDGSLYRLSAVGTLEVDMNSTNEWEYSRLYVSNLLTWEFTEVAQLKTGDIVYYSDSNSPGVTIIKEIIGDRGLLGNGWNFSVRHCKEIRHATPEEVSEYKREQAFAKVGRKLNEFRSGDIVYVEATGETAIAISKQNDIDILLHVFNQTGKGYIANPHQLTPISFVEQQVDLS